MADGFDSKFLIAQSTLSERDFRLLVESRKEELLPLMKFCQLDSLGTMKFLRDGMNQHDLLRDDPQVSGHSHCTLDIKGIFLVQKDKHQTRIADSGYNPSIGKSVKSGMLKIVGLSAEGKWLIIDVSFRGVPGEHQDGYEHALAVRIEEDSLERVLMLASISALEIWTHLNRWIRITMEDKEATAARFRALFNQAAQETDLIRKRQLILQQTRSTASA